MAASPDVIVVGAGVVGAMTTLRLAEAGLRTTLFDADFAGGGSTGAAMGHLVVMDDSDPQLALCAHSCARWQQLAAMLPATVEYHRCGTLWVATDDQELQAAAARIGGYTRWQVHAELVDARQLSRLEPALRPGLAGGLRVADDAVCYPPAAARWLCQRAEQLGATVRDRAAVTRVSAHRVELDDGTAISCGAIVVACGVASPQLIPGLPVIPRRGHLVITDRGRDLVRHQLVELGYLRSAHTFGGASIAFNLQPRRTGQVLIGSSRELVGLDVRPNHSLMAAMLERAIEFVPALAATRALRSWIGFRPATPDKLPLIGRWPALEDMWIATGHEGLGITMATGTADLIVAGITGGPAPVDASPFRPDRPMPLAAAA